MQEQIGAIEAQVSVGGGASELTFVGESEQDAWLQGANRDGSPRPGPADDQKPLADASNSLCFLTKVEIEGMDGPEDLAACSVQVDEFTNWWQVHATPGRRHRRVGGLQRPVHRLGVSATRNVNFNVPEGPGCGRGL